MNYCQPINIKSILGVTHLDRCRNLTWLLNPWTLSMILLSFLFSLGKIDVYLKND